MRFLIIKPSSIGDIAHALPVSRLIKEQDHNAHITWLVNQPYKAMVELCTDVDTILVFHRLQWWMHLWRLRQELKHRTFDYVLDFQGLLRSGLLTFFVKGTHKIGFSDAREGATLFYHRRIQSPANIVHAIDKNIFLINQVLGSRLSYRPVCIREIPAAVEAAKTLLHCKTDAIDQPILSIALGARWQSKVWPVAFMIELIKQIHASLGVRIRIVLVGTATEGPMADRIMLQCQEVPVINCVAKTTLPVLIEILRRSHLLLSNDSGPLHLAVLLGTATVSLFGPTDSRRTGPYGEKHVVFQTKVPCSPCWQKRCPLPRQLCLDDNFSPQDVAQRMIAMLQASQETNLH